MTTSLPSGKYPNVNAPAVSSGRQLTPEWKNWSRFVDRGLRKLLDGLNSTGTSADQAEADAQTAIANAAAAQATANAALPKAGGIMTGPITAANLTTAQKNALTAANGMIVYDTTLGKLQGYQAGAWVNLA